MVSCADLAHRAGLIRSLSASRRELITDVPPSDPRPAPDVTDLPIWTSEAERGHVHDITAARAHVLPAPYRAAAGMPTLADGGYEGAGIGICVPVKNPPGNQRLGPDTKTRNSLLRAASAARENEDSPCSASAGPPSSASPPAPEEPPR